MTEEVRFEWDEAKAASNLAKHGVPFESALRVFDDQGLQLMDTARPGDGEVRIKAIGLVDGRLYTVIHTWRSGLIRLISARPSNAPEERRYDRSIHL